MALEKRTVEMNIYDLELNFARGEVITVVGSPTHAWSSQDLVIAKKKTFEVGSDGKVSFDLIVTDSLPASFHYVVDIAGVLKEKVTVPATLPDPTPYGDLPRVAC